MEISKNRSTILKVLSSVSEKKRGITKEKLLNAVNKELENQSIPLLNEPEFEKHFSFLDIECGAITKDRYDLYWISPEGQLLINK